MPTNEKNPRNRTRNQSNAGGEWLNAQQERDQMERDRMERERRNKRESPNEQERHDRGWSNRQHDEDERMDRRGTDRSDWNSQEWNSEGRRTGGRPQRQNSSPAYEYEDEDDLFEDFDDRAGMNDPENGRRSTARYVGRDYGDYEDDFDREDRGRREQQEQRKRGTAAGNRGWRGDEDIGAATRGRQYDDSRPLRNQFGEEDSERRHNNQGYRDREAGSRSSQKHRDDREERSDRDSQATHGGRY